MTSLPYYYRGADLYIFTDYITAGCPNSVIEALACGIPVAGFKVGVLGEMIDNDSGILVNCQDEKGCEISKNDIDLLADAILKIKADLYEYKKGARMKAETKFSLNEMTDSYINVLELLER